MNSDKKLSALQSLKIIRRRKEIDNEKMKKENINIESFMNHESHGKFQYF